MKKIITSIVSVAGTMLLVAMSVVPVSAATLGVSTSVSASASASSSAVNVNAQAKLDTRLNTIITRSSTAIDARITALNNLSARIASLKNVSATEKSNISNEVTTNIQGLMTLKSKIAADTDVTTAQDDEKMITGDYRIYALVIPQGYIAASADRVDTITSMMATVSAKLQTRITAAQSAGKNVATLQASLSDLNAKITDANNVAATAQAGVATLTPDGGDKTKLQANTTALKSARANIKIATSDLQSAQKDAKAIITGLKGVSVKAAASSTTSVQ